MSKATPGSEFSLVTPPGLRPALLAYLRTHISSPTTTPPAPLVIVTATGRDADETAAAVSAWLPAEQRAGVVVLPAWETLPHERLSPRADTVARRLAVLRRLAHPQLDAPTSAAADPLLPGASRGPISVLVVPVRALLQPLVAGLGDLEPVQVRAGDTVDLDTLTKGLSGAAYARVDLVTERGQFAVRGGIIDVFPPTEPHPVRLELWGDQVEEIRYFSVADQRSLGEAEQGLWAPPCRELLLTPQVRQRAAEEMKHTARLARRLGVDTVVGFTGSSIWQYVAMFPPVPAEKIEAGYADFAERWNPILDVFDSEGVRFAHEVHPSEIAYDYYSTVKTLEAVGHREAFGLNWDPSHMMWQGIDPVDFIYDFADRIYHVDCKDTKMRMGNGRAGILSSHLPWGDGRRGWDFVSAGRGDVPWEQAFRALTAIGYDGPISVEWEDAGMDRLVGAPESLAALKKFDFEPSTQSFDAAFSQD